MFKRLLLILCVLVLVFSCGCSKDKKSKKDEFAPAKLSSKTTQIFITKTSIGAPLLSDSLKAEKATWRFTENTSVLYNWRFLVAEDLTLDEGTLQLVLSASQKKTIQAKVGFSRNGDRRYTASADFVVDSSQPIPIRKRLLVWGFELKAGDEITIFLKCKMSPGEAVLYSSDSEKDSSFIKFILEKVGP